MNKYFDWAATSLPDTESIENALKLSFEFPGNPSALHEPGRKAKLELNRLRTEISNYFKVTSKQIYFTSGGTESNHLVINSLLQKNSIGEIIVSGIEHPSSYLPIKNLIKQGFKVKELTPDSKGICTVESLQKLLSKDTQMISVMGVHNETGAIQPLNELVKLTRDWESKGNRAIHFHADMVQALGKIDFDLTELDVDSASFSGHKIGATRGAGLLYLKSTISVSNPGGGQERGIRSGTENLFGAASLANSIKKLSTDNTKINELSDYLIDQLSKIKDILFFPNGRIENRDLYVPNIINCAFPPLPGEVVVRILDNNGFSISTGSACSANKKSRNESLVAMGISSKDAHCAIRISISEKNSKESLDLLVKTINQELSILRP